MKTPKDAVYTWMDHIMLNSVLWWKQQRRLEYKQQQHVNAKASSS